MDRGSFGFLAENDETRTTTSVSPGFARYSVAFQSFGPPPCGQNHAPEVDVATAASFGGCAPTLLWSANPPPTTTTSTTTTTTATIPGQCTPGTPITITAGGVYSGCYESAMVGTPAVTVNTTQPVRLDHATVRHRGMGVFDVNDTVRGNLTIVNSTFLATNPGSPVNQVDVYIGTLDDPAAIVPTYHVHAEEQLPWFVIADASPRYARGKTGNEPVRHGPKPIA